MHNWKRQHHLFLALLLGIFMLGGLLAVRYDRGWDLTQNQRNQLDEASITLMQQLKKPLHISAFVRGNPKVKALINRLLSRYQAHGDVRWTFKNPDSEIDAVRTYNITRDGQLLLQYQGQKLLVDELNEAAISQGIYTLLQGKNRQVLLLSGHGERNVKPQANGYALLKQRLDQINIEVLGLDIKRSDRLPDGIDLLVLADPQHAYDEQSVAMIADYLQRGGRLLWLAGKPQPALTRLLGARIAEGELLSTDNSDYGLDNPRYIPVIPTHDNQQKILQNIDTMLVFPGVSPVIMLPTDSGAQYRQQPLIQVNGQLMLQQQQSIRKAATPVTLAMALQPLTPDNSTAMPERSTRVWLFGDADFLADGFIGLGQNSDFALSLFTRLTAVDTRYLASIDRLPTPVTVADTTLAYLGLVFIVIIPLLLFVLGMFIRRRLQ